MDSLWHKVLSVSLLQFHMVLSQLSLWQIVLPMTLVHEIPVIGVEFPIGQSYVCHGISDCVLMDIIPAQPKKSWHEHKKSYHLRTPANHHKLSPKQSMSTDQRDKSGTIKNKTGLEKHFEQYNPKPKLKMVDESSNAECQSNLSSEEEWEDEGGKTSKGTKTQNDSEDEDYDPIIEALAQVTDNFTKNHSQIQGDPRLKEGVLNGLDEATIRRLIKNARKRMGYKKQKQAKNNMSRDFSNLIKKRTSTQAKLSDCNPESKKRQNRDLISVKSFKHQSIAETLLQNFTSMKACDLKMRMVTAVDQLLKDDPSLFQTALRKQVELLTQPAIKYYEAKEQVKLTELLSSVSPMAAILLNIEITLVNESLSEEGNTLSYTLLPYIEQCTDFNFLSEDASFMVSRYLKSLVLNIKDGGMSVGKGFMILALKMNPSLLQDIITSEANSTSLIEALIHSGFAQDPALIIAKNPGKFLWPQLLKFFNGKSHSTVHECIQILSKMDILKDPGDQMNALLDIFAFRKLIIDLLIKAQIIQLSLSKLLIVLDTLKRLNSDTIKQCLEQDSSRWEQISIQNQSKEDNSSSNVSTQVMDDLYKKHTQGIDKPVLCKDMFVVSNTMSEECEEYRHCEYQSTIAAIVASQNSNFQVVTLPTGSGKTWVQGLLAKYYCNMGKQVTVVEPNSMLTLQTTEKIGLVHNNISVTSMQDYQQYGSECDILIIDEYDSIITHSPYAFINNSISGLWLLRGKKVIAFSATSVPEVERLVNNCISEPKVLKFISEYELIHGSSPIQEGHIVPCGSYEKVIAAIEAEVEQQYDLRPIIIVANSDQTKSLNKMINKHKHRCFVGVSNETLTQIKDLDYGILIIDAEACRGVDIRFQKDAIVLITARVKTYQEYLQMIGRGSRTRNVSEGILYTDGIDKANIVMQRLKKSNVAMMQELEKVLHFLEQKCLHKAVIEAVSKEHANGKLIISMSDMEKTINPKHFGGIIKDVVFKRRQ